MTMTDHGENAVLCQGGSSSSRKQLDTIAHQLASLSQEISKINSFAIDNLPIEDCLEIRGGATTAGAKTAVREYDPASSHHDS